VINLSLADAVQRHEALECGFFVCGVVIDVHTRKAGKPIHHEGHEFPEGFTLLLTVMSPERPETVFVVFQVVHAKQVLQSALLQRIALHVEKQVTVIRRGQAVIAL